MRVPAGHNCILIIILSITISVNRAAVSLNKLTPRVDGLRAIWSLKITGSVQLEHLLSISMSLNSVGSDAYVLPISWETAPGTRQTQHRCSNRAIFAGKHAMQ